MIKKIVAYLKYKYIQKEKEEVKKSLGVIGKNSYIDIPVHFHGNPNNIEIGDNSVIYGDFRFISVKGHFFVGNNCMSAQGLTVVTDNHVRNVGVLIKDMCDIEKQSRFEDVIVEDDVWIGSNVTLLPGVVIGRGSFVGAGAVIRKSIPPYSVVIGNPQQIIGFNMSPDEIVEHENKLYNPDERLPKNVLNDNYICNPQRILCRGKKIVR